MPITNNTIPPSDIKPSFTGYTRQDIFRYWCQTVLPIVYDDSLSYYELLNKVVNYLNNTISDVASAEHNITELLTAFNELQDYVNNYFYSTEQIQPIINQWLDEHPEATTTVQDGSLTESKFSNALKLSTIKDYVKPEMYGAVGDGETDDTSAVENALLSGKIVLFTQTYLISRTLSITRDIILTDSSTILIGTDIDGLYVAGENINILGKGKIKVGTSTYTHSVITFLGGCKLCSINGIDIEGYDLNIRVGTAISCITSPGSTGRLYACSIACSIRFFEIGVYLYSPYSWLNCFNIDIVADYCDVGLKQVGESGTENRYHRVRIVGEASYYTSDGCGLYVSPISVTGYSKYDINIVDTGVSGHNTILMNVDSSNNIFNVSQTGIIIDKGDNKYENYNCQPIPYVESCLNNIGDLAVFEIIGNATIARANLFNYPKTLNVGGTAMDNLIFTPSTDSDGVKITITIPSGHIHPSNLSIFSASNSIFKTMDLTLSGLDGEETITFYGRNFLHNSIYLERFFKWSSLSRVKSIVAELKGKLTTVGPSVNITGFCINDTYGRIIGS